MNSPDRTESIFPMQPEEKLLLLSMQWHLDEERVSRLKTLVGIPLKWDLLYILTEEHRIIPLLFRSLKIHSAETVPVPFLKKLQARFQENARRNLLLTAELLEMCDLLQSHGISVIAYKGPVLAAELYGDISYRQFADLDIVVRKRDAWHAKELLFESGCMSVYPHTSKQDLYTLRSQCHYQLRSQRGVFIELHWGITPDYFSIPLDIDLFFDRTRKVSVAGRPIPTFSPEDMLLVLSIHGAKHLWHRLIWLADIHQLLQRHPMLDWDSLFKRAQRSHVQRIVLLSLLLVKDLFQENLPQDVRGRISQDRSVSALSQQIRKRLALHMYGPASFGEMPLFLRMRERRRDQLLYSFRYALVLATPTEKEWNRFHFPERFYFLYYFIRPLRLLAKYLRRGIKIVLKQVVRKERFSATKRGGSASHFGGELNKCAEGEI